MAARGAVAIALIEQCAHTAAIAANGGRMRRYETTDLSLGHTETLEVRADGTVWLTGGVVAEVSREWGAWYLCQVRTLGRKYPGRYATVRTTGA